jgi:PAS domain S-box-containing protein
MKKRSIRSGITKRKQAKEALRESEEMFNGLFEQSPFSIQILDANGWTLKVNKGWERLWNSTPDMLANYNMLRDPQLKESGALEYLKKAFSGEAVTIPPMEYSVEKQAGKGPTRWVQARAFPVKDDSGDVSMVIVMHEDFTEQRRAEEAIKEKQQQTQTILETITVPTIISRLSDGKMLYVNQALAQLSHMALEELMGRQTTEFFVNSDDRDRITGLLQRQGCVSDFEVQIRGGDGAAYWVLLSAQTINYQNETCVLSSFVDITGHKQAEESLQESEQRFRTLAEASFEGIELTDKGVIVDLNDQLAEMLGYGPGELIGINVMNIVAPESRDLIMANVRAGYEGPYEHLAVKKDGSVFPVEVRTRSIPYRGRLARVTAIRDVTERKRAEASLRDSEEKYSAVVRQAKDGVIIIQDKILTFVNEAMADILGYNPGEMENTPFISYVAPESRAVVAAYVRARLAGEDVPNVYEAKLLRKDSTTIDAELSASVIQHRGKPIDIGIIRDITEHKKAVEALRQSEEKFRNLVETTSDWIWETDAEYNYSYSSPRIRDLLGYEPDEVIGRKPFDLMPPDEARRLEADFALIHSRHQPFFNLENVNLRKDGKEVILETSGVPRLDSRGRFLGYRGIDRDITERKQGEEALRESEARFRRVVESSPLAIGIVDKDDRILYLNPKFVEKFGYTLDDIPTQERWFRLAYPDPGYRQAVVEQWQMALERAVKESHIAHAVEVKVTCKDGSMRSIEVFGTPMGERILAIFNDLTERKRMEEERSRLEDHMREVQKLESLGVLAGGIAHDFNNLLQAVLGHADMALLSLSSVSPAYNNIKEIINASQRAADLCRQMLAYSGRGRFVISRYDFAEIVQEMSHILQVSVSKKATLRYRLASDLPAVEADATQLRQVVMNLITNASEALGDSSGTIEISIGVMDCDKDYLSESYMNDNLPGGRYIYLEVSDTGCGMDAETLNRMFDPFFTTKFTGRGLGLAAVLGIVRGHKGTIRVHSEIGKGTTFKVLLPAVEWTPGDREKPVEKAASMQSGSTILIIDDDPDVLKTTATILKKMGFQVLTARNGREGIEVFRAQKEEISCVILDLTMPDMGGEEVFTELQTLRSDVCVILSSGYNEQDVSQRFVGKGLAGFIQKPYSMAKLRENLSRVLRQDKK